MKDITVYLADDHTLLRKGMIRLLQSFDYISRIEEAENGKKLIDLVEKNTPDVVLLDIRMPIMNGIEACGILAKKFTDVKILVFTMNDGPEMVDMLLKQGAHGFLSKGSNTDEL